LQGGPQEESAFRNVVPGAAGRRGWAKSGELAGARGRGRTGEGSRGALGPIWGVVGGEGAAGSGHTGGQGGAAAAAACSSNGRLDRLGERDGELG
jgi:hypothetical protein